MARPFGAIILVSMLIGLLLPGGSGAQSQVPAPVFPSAEVQYEGPIGLRDPRDPLQGVAWTLGYRLPPRTRLSPGRTPPSPRTEYDLQRGRVLIAYQSESQDIRPPQILTEEAYGEEAFRARFREAWIAGNRNVIQESQTRLGNRRDGLISVNLPALPFSEKLFGEGVPNLRVSGSEHITISGASSWVVGQVTGERGGGSLFPKLDMRQQLNINLQGTIGTKLFIDVAQNSEALTPLENSIKIRYRGEEDDVVQSVELGNTNLSLPPNQFVSYSARQEGLFGVKTEASVGNIDFTAIASRQEGETGQASYVGGAETRVERIHDWQYIPGTYFFVADPDSAPAPQLISIRVYLDDRTVNNDLEQGAQDGYAWIDPEAKTPDRPYFGAFHLLTEQTDYRVLNTDTYAMPVLVLNNRLAPRHVLAVSYRALGAFGDTVTVGTFNLVEGDTLQLKMLRPGEDKWGTDERNNVVYSPWAPVRRLEMKNAYSLRARNIDVGGFELRIVRDIAGEGGNNPFTLENEFGRRTPYLEVLGLDQRNNANPNDKTPDGRVDQEFLDAEAGVIFFPDLRPFDPSLADIEGTPFRRKSWPITSADRPDTLGWRKGPSGAVPSPASVRDQETVPEIYDLLPTTLSNDASDYHLYTLEATIENAVNQIQLNTLGQPVIEGSETVRLNGNVLTRGPDYDIFYDTGTITLKKPEATAPGADLRVTYSYDSIFSRGSQSLVGGSISTHQDQTTKLSFSSSWLHESRGTPDLRPRLGQEPTKTTVGDLAGRLRLEPWALTDLVDAIPLVDTNAPSRMEVSAAVGVSLPNPNTRDVVYVDDMEGAELFVGPTMNRGSWFYSSAPARAVRYINAPGRPFEQYTPDPTHRGELLWFTPNTVQVSDITPREDAESQRDDPVSVLEVIYIPRDSAATPFDSWGGLVAPVSGGGADVSDYQYIEIWVNDYLNHSEASQRRGELLIDVGTVSEDAVWDPLTPPAPPNGILDIEDQNRSGGQIDADEDLGLDGLFSQSEPPPPPGSKRLSHLSASEDPAGDNKKRDIETHLPERTIAQRIAKYQGINGTEDNDLPDGEDLDANNQLDPENDYREYRVDLAAPALIDVGRDFGVLDGDNGWRLYRIPLEEFHFAQGVPNLSQVKHMRIWFTGVAPGDTLDLQIASVEIVGNRWEASPDLGLGPEEIFNVSVVNNKENSDYIEPFGVERINQVKDKEQSISLDFEDLRPDSEIRAFRRLLDARDYTLYQNLAFYVNPRFGGLPADSVEFYVRFSSDASNDTTTYYELATVLTESDPRRRADGWLDFRVPITDMSRLKIGAPPGVLPDSFLVGPGDVVGGETAMPRSVLDNGLRVTIRGQPSFSRVRRISVGMRSLSGFPLPRGSVWFNELRMGQVRRDRGMASRGSINLQLADLASITGSIDVTDADFLRLGQIRGSGTRNVRYDLRTQIGLHKFMEAARLNAPLNLRYGRVESTPKFRTNSDVLFDGRDSGREISEYIERGADLSLSRDPRGRTHPIARYTIDGIRLRGSVRQSQRSEVTRADTTTTLDGGANYLLNLGQVRPFRLLKRIEFAPWPRSVSVGLNGARTERRVWTPTVTDPNVLVSAGNSVTRTGALNLSATAQPIGGLGYTWGSTRDLVNDHFGPDSSLVQMRRPAAQVLGVNVGREVTQTHNLTFNYTPPYLGQTLRPRFNWTSGSSKDFGPNLTLDDYDDVVFNISNTNNGSLSMTVPVSRWIDKIAGPPRTSVGAGGRRVLSDTTSAATRNDEGELRTFFTKIFRPKDIQATGTLGRRSSYSRINGSPSPVYVLGLTRDIGLGEDVFTVGGAPFNTTAGNTVTIRGSTSAQLFREIGMDLNYQRRRDRNQTNSLVANLRTEITWPEVRFNWGEIHERLPLINKLFSDFRAVTSTYSKSTSIVGTEEEPEQTRTVTSRWSPLVSIQGTLAGWRTNLNSSRTSTSSISSPLGGAKTTSERSSISYQLGMAKKLTRPGGGRGKDIDLKVDLTYTTTSSIVRSSFSNRPQESKEQNVRLNTSSSFRMTSSMTGTLQVELSQNRRPTTDWTRRSIRLSFSTGFNF